MVDPMGILTWNINFRSADSLAAIDAHAADFAVVTLQEVKPRYWSDIQQALKAMGLPNAVFTGENSSYGNVIASRFALERIDNDIEPWPELVAHIVVQAPGCPFHAITVHAPNGSGNGWAKIQTLEGLRAVVREYAAVPIVITGDFNEPQLTSLHEGSVVTWGQTESDDGFVTWDQWRSDSPRDTGERWDEVVRWFFDAESSGLHHAYRRAHEGMDLPETHVSGGIPRSYDHILVSSGVEVIECDCVPGTRPAHSDHTAVLAKLRIAPCR